jgi:glycerol-3-phosphate dehydrogenase subunit B
MTLRAETVTLPATPAGGWAVASLAAYLERDASVLSVLQRFEARRIILPAVLGLQGSRALHEQLEHDLGCEVGEALAATPSLPGWRLHHALALALAHAGVTIHNGTAVMRGDQHGKIAFVAFGEEVASARSFVLATGKFIGGGIAANGVFHETVFDCPVWVDHLQEVFESPDPILLTDAERAQPQPLLQAGVHADDQHRPVNRRNDVVYENVFVAGSIRAGWEAGTEMGACAEDGWNAGLKASAA